MLFDEMSQIARNVVSQRMSQNMPLSFNDTICVAFTSSSKIYVGVSSMTMVLIPTWLEGKAAVGRSPLS